MPKVTRSLTETELAIRLANQVLDQPNADPDDDLAMLSRQLLRARENFAPRSMETAPRDGSHFLGYLYSAPDDGNYRGFGEWREIFFREYRGPFGPMPWHAGDPYDSHDGAGADSHFGEALPIAWLPLPPVPLNTKFRRTGGDR